MLENKKLLATRLGWWILEQKLFYYYPNKYGKCVDDSEYDKNEDKYKSLCSELGIEPTACSSVGFPHDTPSGKLVISKFSDNKNAQLTDINIRTLERVRARNDVQVRTRTRGEQRIRPRKRST